jgi:hypothetical protein
MNIEYIKRPHGNGVGPRALRPLTGDALRDHLPTVLVWALVWALVRNVTIAAEYSRQFADRTKAQSPFTPKFPASGPDAAAEYYQ